MNIFTDGACRENARQDGVAEGKGGWAYVVLTQAPGQDMKTDKEGSGHKVGTTNQEMEIHAVVEAFRSLGRVTEPINLYSDSAYVINCLKDRWYDKWKSNGWLNSKMKPVRNRDTWENLIDVVNKFNVNFYHISRNSSKYIRVVDAMAKKASKQGTSQE